MPFVGVRFVNRRSPTRNTFCIPKLHLPGIYCLLAFLLFAKVVEICNFFSVYFGKFQTHFHVFICCIFAQFKNLNENKATHFSLRLPNAYFVKNIQHEPSI